MIKNFDKTYSRTIQTTLQNNRLKLIINSTKAVEVAKRVKPAHFSTTRVDYIN